MNCAARSPPGWPVPRPCISGAESAVVISLIDSARTCAICRTLGFGQRRGRRGGDRGRLPERRDGEQRQGDEQRGRAPPLKSVRGF